MAFVALQGFLVNRTLQSAIKQLKIKSECEKRQVKWTENKKKIP